jgi:hypothetical protein
MAYFDCKEKIKMKMRFLVVCMAIMTALWAPITIFAQDTSLTSPDIDSKETWSYYMDHVIRLLDYVEVTTSLRETFDTEIKSNLDLFEKKQKTLDFIAMTEQYLAFLEEYRSKKNNDKTPSISQEEDQKIQLLGLPSIETVRTNLVLAAQTKALLDKMMTEKSSWDYKKSQLVFKNNSIQEQYTQLQKKLATVDQPILDPSMLTQRDNAR